VGAEVERSARGRRAATDASRPWSGDRGSTEATIAVRLDRRARVASRAAISRPARQPGARPPDGTSMPPGSRPALAINQEITEFEFHMSPVRPSSRPHTRAGTDGTRSSTCDAWAGSSVTRTGLETASAISGMTPSRHRRTSYRKSRKRPATLEPTGPSRTTPRRSPCMSGIGVCSITKRPSGATTTRAE
jgi:hypothetical protein